jgi:hypothetical protein
VLIALVGIVRAENTNGICDIGPSGSYYVHRASDHRWVDGRISWFCLGLPLAQLHCHWRGNLPGLIRSELYHNHPNVAMLMDVDHVMLMIAFDVHAEIK